MTKVADEELKEINDLREQIGRSTYELGANELQVRILTGENHALVSQIRTLLEKQEELVKRLHAKYGTVSVDFDTGDITPE